MRYGVGFITWSLATQPRLLDLVLERRPAAVMLSFGDPAPFVERIHRAGAAVICQVQSLALATAAAAAGADILVAQGTEGAGHGAVRGMATLVPEVVDAVGDRVPVVAAGGLADGRGLAASLMLGAAGVLMGTRFYATREAAGADAAKERIRSSDGDATVRSMVFDIARKKAWPAPFTGRCLDERLHRALVRARARAAAPRRRGVRSLRRRARRGRLRRARGHRRRGLGADPRGRAGGRGGRARGRRGRGPARRREPPLRPQRPRRCAGASRRRASADSVSVITR